MKWTESEVLEVLDECARAFTFPALDNGYVYPAKTRLSAYSSNMDWALVIEVFGFSPRSGCPDVQLYTFSNQVRRSRDSQSFVNEEAFSSYIRSNPYNESSFVYPIYNESWIDEDDGETAIESEFIDLRGTELKVPTTAELASVGIQAEEESPLVFEVCRWLAEKAPSLVLATEQEKQANLPAGVVKQLEVEEWNHPDITGEELPSQKETFQQIASVLITGRVSAYQPSEEPNTHWSNWPEAGTL
ncbi:DUF7003 family protein [Marinobacter shengliensis]